MTGERITVYVQLKGEGTDVWRPTSAIRQDDGSYILTDENYDPATEEWFVVPGSTVTVVRKGTGADAVSIAVGAQ